MVKFFKDKPTNATRSLQIWQILISRASNRQTITYGMLSKMLGFGGAGVLARVLGHILHYCRQNKLPPLTVLVVNKDTGLPGEGLGLPYPDADREAVFQYDWFGIFPPTPDELRRVYREG